MARMLRRAQSSHMYSMPFRPSMVIVQPDGMPPSAHVAVVPHIPQMRVWTFFEPKAAADRFLGVGALTARALPAAVRFLAAGFLPVAVRFLAAGILPVAVRFLAAGAAEPLPRFGERPAGFFFLAVI